MCGAAARRNGYYNLGVTHIIHGYWEEGRALIQVAQPSTRTFVIDGTPGGESRRGVPESCGVRLELLSCA